MNFIKRAIIRHRLRKTMKPDPEYRDRRLAQFDAARTERYWANVGFLR